MKKTNAVRMLEKMGVSYELREYPVDLDDLGAEHAAEVTGVPLERVFKTLVARADGKNVLLACVPGTGELNLKGLASLAGHKKAEMVHLREVQGLTGYVRGGVSPLGTKKAFPVFLDESALQFQTIAVNAGKRGTLLLVEPAELVRILNATMGPLIK